MSRMDSGKSPRISTPGRPSPRKLPLYSPSDRSPFRFCNLSLNQQFIGNISVSMMTLSRFSPLILSSKMVSFHVSRYMYGFMKHSCLIRNTKFDILKHNNVLGTMSVKDLVRAISINFNKFQFLANISNEACRHKQQADFTIE